MFRTGYLVMKKRKLGQRSIKLIKLKFIIKRHLADLEIVFYYFLTSGDKISGSISDFKLLLQGGYSIYSTENFCKILFMEYFLKIFSSYSSSTCMNIDFVQVIKVVIKLYA